MFELKKVFLASLIKSIEQYSDLESETLFLNLKYSYKYYPLGLNLNKQIEYSTSNIPYDNNFKEHNTKPKFLNSCGH